MPPLRPRAVCVRRPKTCVGETWKRERCSHVALMDASGRRREEELGLEQEDLADVVVDFVVRTPGEYPVPEQDLLAPVPDPEGSERERGDEPPRS